MKCSSTRDVPACRARTRSPFSSIFGSIGRMTKPGTGRAENSAVSTSAMPAPCTASEIAVAYVPVSTDTVMGEAFSLNTRSM
jgi:hypothetical protein